MNREQLITFMRKQQGKRTAKQFSAWLGISQAYLSDIYAGRRDPGQKVLEALNVTRKVEYQKGA